MDTNDKSVRRHDIQGLRFLAALIVIGTHGLLFDVHGGVDVFYVISGFIITHKLLADIAEHAKSGERGKWDFLLWEFYRRRMKRLLPIGLLVAVVTLGLAWLVGPPLRFHQTVEEGFRAVFFTINWLLADKGVDYFANTSVSPYQHYWSLSVEEQFYLVVPVLLIALAWLGRKFFKGSKVPMVLVLVAIIAGSFALSVLLTKSSPSLAYFAFRTRAWELAIGVLIAVTIGFWERLPKGLAAAMTWVGLATILVTAWLISPQTPLPGWAMAGPVLGAAMVIAGGCANPAKGAVWVLGRKLPVYLGDVSYGWYLWHWPIIVFWPNLFGRPMEPADGILVLLGSLVLAIATYYTVEQPFRYSKASLSKVYVTTFTALACMSLLFIVAARMPVNLPKGGPAVAAAAPNASIQSVIEDATKVTQLPSNVQPPLTQAQLDRANVGCIDEMEATAPSNNPRCIIGDIQSSKTVVVLGDSHAWQWGNTFDAIGKKNGWRMVMVTKGACSPGEYPDLYSYHFERTYTECAQWRPKAIQNIVALKPMAVIIAAVARAEVNEQGMRSTLTKLTTGTKPPKLVFLVDTPQPGLDVPTCLADNPQDVGMCAAPRATALKLPQARKLERQTAEKAGAKVVDMTDHLCTSTVCPAIINGMVVYFDDNHLTRTYALSLAGPLGERLATAVA